MKGENPFHYKLYCVLNSLSIYTRYGKGVDEMKSLEIIAYVFLIIVQILIIKDIIKGGKK